MPNKKKKTYSKLQPLLWGASLFALLLSASPALSNPQDGLVVGGSASFSYSDNRLDVQQHTSRAVIDWRSFDIAADEHTQFHQPSSKATILNRVTGGGASQILGQITANGNVIIVNPDGIFFGKDSRVDVNGLIATSAGIANQDFMTGLMQFTQAGRSDAQIINEGTITAKEAGLVGLVAPSVVNSGYISARLGRVELASGDRFSLDFFGDGLIGLDIGDATEKQKISHTGMIEAAGGTVVLSAAAGRKVVDSLIEVKGEIKAPTISQKAGKIVISAKSAAAPQSQSIVMLDGGRLDVSGRRNGEKGGEISVTADAVVLKGATSIDASGDVLGGHVRIGGDYLGRGDLQTAKVTLVDKSVDINVNALRAGDGGTVIVWADIVTEFLGKIFARGGVQSGDGGFVEVSGKRHLKFRGDVDTRAENGVTGQLLLDPADIVILEGGGDSAADGAGTFSGDPSGIIGTILAGDVGPSILYQSELEGISGTTNMAVAATNSITINDLSSDVLNFAQTSGRGVTMTAGAGGITMLDVNDVIATAGGALTFVTTSGGGVALGGINTNGGLTTFNVAGVSSVQGVIGGAGGITKTGAGNLSLHGVNTYSGNTTLTSGALYATNDNALGTSLLIMNGGQFGASGAPLTIANDIRLNQNTAGQIVGDQDIEFTGIMTNFNGNRTLNVNSTGMTTFSNAIHLSQNTTNRTLTIGGSGDVTVSGGIVKGGGGTDASNFTKTGSGTLYLTGTSSHTGSTTTSGAGSLMIADQAGLGGMGLVILNGGGLGSIGDLAISNAIRLSANSRIEGADNLTLNGLFSQFGGSRILTLNSAGLTTVNGDLSLSDSVTNRTLTLSGSGNALLNGVVSNGLSSASNLIKTGAGILTLGGNNTYTGNTTLTSGALYATNDNALGTSLLIMNGGQFGASGAPLTIANDIRLNQNTAGQIVGDQDIEFTGIMTNFNGNRTLNVNSTGMTTFSNAIHLSQNTTNRTLTIGGSGDVTVSSGIVKGGGGTDASNFTKTGSGTLTLNGINTYTGNTVVNGGRLLLGASERIAAGSNLTVGAGGIFDVSGYTQTVSSVANNGEIRLGNGGELFSAGAQNHNNGFITGHNATIGSTGTGAINGSSPLSLFTGSLNILTSGPIDFLHSTGLTLGNVQGSTVRIGTSSGGLTLEGQVSALNTSGITIQLHTPGVFTNNYGASVLQLAPAARFQVFSNDSRDDTRGGLTGFNRYGCTYNAGSPSCAATTNIPALGSGFYLAYAPTLTISGVSANNKVYDATTNATLSGVAALDGILNGDSITFDDSGATASFDNKNAGNSKAVTVGGYALAGIDHGYLFVQPSGITADIMPLQINVNGLSAQSKVYDGSAVATLLGLAGISPLGGDDLTIIGTPSGSFTNRNVGNNKSVNVTGLSLVGADAANYTIGLPTLTADITPRPLSVASFTAANKVFDGNTSALVTAYFFNNDIAGDSIFLNNIVASFDSSTVALGKTVSLSSADFVGADAVNYSFTLGSITTLANITEQVSGKTLPDTYSHSSQSSMFLEMHRLEDGVEDVSLFRKAQDGIFTRLFGELVLVHSTLARIYNIYRRDKDNQ